MEDQGLIGPLDIDVRMQLCTTVRRHLDMACGLSPHSYPALSHDKHFVAICEVLRKSLLPLWLAEPLPSQTSLTCIVYDRFNRQMVTDATGERAELVETNPVHSAALGAESLAAVVTLYCQTHDNGEGWRYEWGALATKFTPVQESPRLSRPIRNLVGPLPLANTATSRRFMVAMTSIVARNP